MNETQRRRIAERLTIAKLALESARAAFERAAEAAQGSPVEPPVRAFVLSLEKQCEMAQEALGLVQEQEENVK